MINVPSDKTLRDILARSKVIAVVGASNNPTRPSHYVSAYLQSKGYRIIPVNPGQAGQTLLGELVYASLGDIPSDIAVDMVDIFRPSDTVPPIVDQAIASLPQLKTIWMQVDIRNDLAAKQAEEAGLAVVQDLCTKMEHQRLLA